jgi:hypothetical protein
MFLIGSTRQDRRSIALYSSRYLIIKKAAPGQPFTMINHCTGEFPVLPFPEM